MFFFSFSIIHIARAVYILIFLHVLVFARAPFAAAKGFDSRTGRTDPKARVGSVGTAFILGYRCILPRAQIFEIYKFTISSNVALALHGEGAKYESFVRRYIFARAIVTYKNEMEQLDPYFLSTTATGNFFTI